MKKARPIKVKLSDLELDPVGDMLVAGENMKPYISHLKAQMTGADIEATLAAIAALPVEKRYLFRIEQCLGWALADFDSETAKLDAPYMPDLAATIMNLKVRVYQLLRLLEVLQGE